MPSPTVCFLGNEVSLSGKGKASEICVIDRRSWGMEFWHVLSPLFPLQYNRQFNLVSSCDLSLLSAMSLPSYARRLNYSKKSLKWFCRKNYMMWNYLYYCAFRVFFCSSSSIQTVSIFFFSRGCFQSKDNPHFHNEMKRNISFLSAIFLWEEDASKQQMGFIKQLDTSPDTQKLISDESLTKTESKFYILSELVFSSICSFSSASSLILLFFLHSLHIHPCICGHFTLISLLLFTNQTSKAWN